MPRYYRARGYRGYRRYGRSRVLSTRNIYARRSSIAQASQIAALRRRVFKIARAAKPEKKVKTDTPQTATFSSRAGGDVHLVFSVPDIVNSSTDTGRIGDKIFRRDSWNMSFEYYNNSNTG